MGIDFGYLDRLVEKADKAMGKKYSTKDRKAMKKGSFCGPNRSFPVTDCQHVGTAKAFLNRSKFSAATKKRIASCINGKEKSLGCGKGKPAKAKGSILDELKGYTFETLSKEEQALFNSEVFASTKALVERSQNNPGMDLELGECATCDEE